MCFPFYFLPQKHQHFLSLAITLDSSLSSSLLYEILLFLLWILHSPFLLLSTVPTFFSSQAWIIISSLVSLPWMSHISWLHLWTTPRPTLLHHDFGTYGVLPYSIRSKLPTGFHDPPYSPSSRTIRFCALLRLATEPNDRPTQSFSLWYHYLSTDFHNSANAMNNASKPKLLPSRNLFLRKSQELHKSFVRQTCCLKLNETSSCFPSWWARSPLSISKSNLNLGSSGSRTLPG